jgi:hypothetical protein
MILLHRSPAIPYSRMPHGLDGFEAIRTDSIPTGKGPLFYIKSPAQKGTVHIDKQEIYIFDRYFNLDFLGRLTGDDVWECLSTTDLQINEHKCNSG